MSDSIDKLTRVIKWEEVLSYLPEDLALWLLHERGRYRTVIDKQAQTTLRAVTLLIDNGLASVALTDENDRVRELAKFLLEEKKT